MIINHSLIITVIVTCTEVYELKMAAHHTASVVAKFLSAVESDNSDEENDECSELSDFESEISNEDEDCCLFAIAMVIAIAFGNDPSKQNFYQELMRAHLVDCLKNERFSMFP